MQLYSLSSLYTKNVDSIWLIGCYTYGITGFQRL